MIIIYHLMSICKAFSVSTMQIHCLQIGIFSITVTCASFIAGWVHFYCLLFGGQFKLYLVKKLHHGIPQLRQPKYIPEDLLSVCGNFRIVRYL